jgi:hypothetical protein
VGEVLYVEDDFTERAPSGEFGLEEAEGETKVVWYTGPIDSGEELAQGVASELVVGGSGLWERHGIVSEVKERKENGSGGQQSRVGKGGGISDRKC